MRIVNTPGSGVFFGGDSNAVKDTVVASTGNHAVRLAGSGNTAAGNKILVVPFGNDGIFADGSGSVIKSNTVVNATGDGITLSSADDSIVSDNTVDESGANGVLVEGSVNVRVLDNTVTGSQASNGIGFIDQSGVVRGNTAIGNALGIAGCTEDIAVRNNTAKWNFSFGIVYHPDSASSGNSSRENGDQNIFVGGCP